MASYRSLGCSPSLDFEATQDDHVRNGHHQSSTEDKGECEGTALT